MKTFDNVILEFPPMEEHEIQALKGGQGSFAFSASSPVMTIVGTRNSDQVYVYYNQEYGGGYDPGGSAGTTGTGSGSATGTGTTNGGSLNPANSNGYSPTISTIKDALNNPQLWQDLGNVVIGTAEALVGAVGAEISAGTSAYLVIDGLDRSVAAIHNFTTDLDTQMGQRWPGNIGGQIGSLGGATAEKIGNLTVDGITGVLTGGPIRSGVEAYEAFQAGKTIKYVISGYTAASGLFDIHEYLEEALPGLSNSTSPGGGGTGIPSYPVASFNSYSY